MTSYYANLITGTKIASNSKLWKTMIQILLEFGEFEEIQAPREIGVNWKIKNLFSFRNTVLAQNGFLPKLVRLLYS